MNAVADEDRVGLWCRYRSEPNPVRDGGVQGAGKLLGELAGCPRQVPRDATRSPTWRSSPSMVGNEWRSPRWMSWCAFQSGDDSHFVIVAAGEITVTSEVVTQLTSSIAISRTSSLSPSSLMTPSCARHPTGPTRPASHTSPCSYLSSC